jgi:YVTN family beta-propeller protein
MRLSLRACLVSAALALFPGCVHACGQATPAPGPLLYTSDEQGGVVVVLEPGSGRVVDRVTVGKRPRGLKISPDGRRLYVALSGSPRTGPGVEAASAADRSADGVGVVDVWERRLVEVLPAGQDPEALDLSPDGRTLYVSNEETAELTVLDLPGGRVRGKVRVGHEPEGVAVRPDGAVVFVTSEQDAEVTAIDAASLTVVGHVPTGPRPRSVVLTRDGLTGFVADEMGARVTLFDPATLAVRGDVAVHLDSPMPSGPRPMGAALSPNEKLLFVTCGRGGAVAVIDVASRKQVRSIDGVGDRPWGIASSADGTRLYTANGTSSDLSIVSLATGNVDRRVYVGGLPWGVAMGR